MEWKIAYFDSPSRRNTDEVSALQGAVKDATNYGSEETQCGVRNG